MYKQKNISTYQLFCVLQLSRLLSLLTLVFHDNTNMQPTDCLLGVFFGGVGVILFSLPLLYYVKTYPKLDLLDIAFLSSKKLSKVVAVFYALFFSYFAFLTLITLKLFVGTSVFPNDEGTFFMIVCLIAACYCAYLGLEAIGRAGAIALGIFVLSFSLIIFMMGKKVSLFHFSPLFLNGISPAVSFGLRSAGVTYELAVFFFLAPKVKALKVKRIFNWIFSLLFFIFLILFFTFGGLGSYALHQLFPVYSMAALAEFSVFKRFDVLLTGIWILTALLKISLLLLLQSEILKKSFGEKVKGQYIVVMGIILLIGQMLLKNKLQYYGFISNSNFKIILTVLFAFLLPMLLFLLVFWKRRKSNEKN